MAIVSVRNLVEFILRSGSIDSRYMGANRAQEGTRIHQKIQKERKKEAVTLKYEYSSEVVLKYTFQYKDIEFTVEGRADGIIKTTDGVTIEEIKSTCRHVSEIECDLDSWHFAQAKCYGYMYCETEKSSRINIRLTYCNIETEEVIFFEKEYTFDELKEFFMSLIEEYYFWVKMDSKRIIKRNEDIKSLKFPFDSYRKGQREFAIAVYKTVKNKKKVFAELPTGTGKTASSLFPVIKALGENLCEKIFYLTAKTITRQVAEQTLKIMGISINSVTLTAKDKICPYPERVCLPQECPRAAGHFDRVNNALWDVLTNENIVQRDIVSFYGDKHSVCPYELSLDIAMWSSVIICDYNYIFDPKVQLKRFFSNTGKTRYIALIDEAHNLVERSREMFSALLYRGDFTRIRKLIKPRTPLHKVLSKIDKHFSHMNKTYLKDDKTHTGLDSMDSDLYYLLISFQEKCDAWLILNEGAPEASEVLELYFKVIDYMRTSEYFDERYVFYVEKNMVKLLCLDPSYMLAQTHAKLLSEVFFSATFTPLDYFRDVLGGDGSDYYFKLPSPFNNENLLVLVNNKISTKYKDREMSYESIADCLYRMIDVKQGNYFAFFSSYQYMQSVYNIFTKKYSCIATLLQQPEMSEDSREEFLNHFNIGNSVTLLGFVVLGGVFSEGIDLAGDRLIGAAIIGVGLPLITNERNFISSYYNKKNINGFKFAYVYPGMNKVMQAAGRVIRTENDKGVVFLIDSRFLTYDYRCLFPAHWQHYITANEDNVIRDNIDKFWFSL